MSGPEEKLRSVDVDIPARKSRVPVIAAAVVVVGLGVGLLVYGLRQEAAKMSVPQIMEAQKNVFVLPEKEQIPRWRKWAASRDVPMLQREALRQLALLGDPEGVKLATLGLGEPLDHRLRGVAAQVLAHYGLPAADSAKPALLAALKEADLSDERQIVWTLVVLKEASIFTKAMELYRNGQLTTVQRLEGGGAFDPRRITSLISLDELAKLAGDESVGVRQLVATILSENAEAKWTDALIKLVQDKELVVARQAASGLGKIGDERAREPLLQALRSADDDSRKKFLDALRDGIGGVGLVLALDTVDQESEQRQWFQYRQLFKLIELLADPRAGDALLAWVERVKPHQHWRTEVGLRLAEIGDARGAAYIGERMPIEAKDLYTKQKFWQADEGGHLLGTDRQRIIGGRMLADLAKMLSDKRPGLLAAAEEPVIKWLTARPQPHANGLRFLAIAGSAKALPLMRDWAFPPDKLPVEGQQPPFPKAFETAQSGLRYIGVMKDGQSFEKLLDQFERKKDRKMDITQKGLEGAGLAMLGMALRAVTLGASHGLAEWGDPRAEKKMMEFIEDETWNEEARLGACESLAWLASPEGFKKVVEKTREFAAKTDPKQQFIGACYAQTLARRPDPEVVPMLVETLRPDMEIHARVSLAQAIGLSGLAKHPEAEQRLFDHVKSSVELRTAAALALVLGGSADTAARTVAKFADFEKVVLDDLKDLYYLAFGYWSHLDLDNGNIYRWVENAEAISRVRIAFAEPAGGAAGPAEGPDAGPAEPAADGLGAPQRWAIERLAAQFDGLQFDNGPHSETRVVLRYRLIQAAKTGTPELKRGAIRTLKFMKEQGSLMALRQEPGETGEFAARAFHELKNPRAEAPEDLSKFEDQKKKQSSSP